MLWAPWGDPQRRQFLIYTPNSGYAGSDIGRYISGSRFVPFPRAVRSQRGDDVRAECRQPVLVISGFCRFQSFWPFVNWEPREDDRVGPRLRATGRPPEVPDWLVKARPNSGCAHGVRLLFPQEIITAATPYFLRMFSEWAFPGGIISMFSEWAYSNGGLPSKVPWPWLRAVPSRSSWAARVTNVIYCIFNVRYPVMLK
eukprot:scaffold65600_cov107-Phaeocystis_antarctica.AAC.2